MSAVLVCQLVSAKDDSLLCVTVENIYRFVECQAIIADCSVTRGCGKKEKASQLLTVLLPFSLTHFTFYQHLVPQKTLRYIILIYIIRCIICIRKYGYSIHMSGTANVEYNFMTSLINLTGGPRSKIDLKPTLK